MKQGRLLLLDVVLVALFVFVAGAGALSAAAFLDDKPTTTRNDHNVNVCHQATECHIRLNRLLQAADPGEPILLARGEEGAEMSVPASEPGTNRARPSQGRAPRSVAGGRTTPRSRARAPRATPAGDSSPPEPDSPADSQAPVSEPPSGPTGPTETQLPSVLEPICKQAGVTLPVC